MKTFFLFIAAVIAVAQTVNGQTDSSITDLSKEWDSFKMTYHKRYSNNVEEKFRMTIYMENKRKVDRHNAKYKVGLVSYKLGLNKYADMLNHEFVNMLNGFNKSTISPQPTLRPLGPTFMKPANVVIPESVNWRTNGAVTAVKDQGHCGACWAFSATGALEGQYFRKTGVLMSLSEQNLMDCSRMYGNTGCEGGSMDRAFQYIKDNGGINTENSYPYEGQSYVCRYNRSNRRATNTGFVYIPYGDEENLKAAVAMVGPVAVAIDASHESFQLYAMGVYDEPECSSDSLDHGVLAVGYGTDENGSDYWLVKNSWGDKWGEKGYIKMARNRDNQCGISSSASYPLV